MEIRLLSRETGPIAADSGNTMSSETLAWVRNRSDKPISNIIYSHHHHTSAARAYAEDARNKGVAHASDKIPASRKTLYSVVVFSIKTAASPILCLRRTKVPVNYNSPDKPGRYLSFAPIVMANLEADSGEKRTVPLGGGIGQIIKWGKTPVNLQASAYYHVEPPENGADWQMRLQVQFLFPK